MNRPDPNLPLREWTDDSGQTYGIQLDDVPPQAMSGWIDLRQLPHDPPQKGVSFFRGGVCVFESLYHGPAQNVNALTDEELRGLLRRD